MHYSLKQAVNWSLSACVHEPLCPSQWIRGRPQVQSPHIGARLIVLNCNPSFHNQKQDFLSRHCKRGKRECVSAPASLSLCAPSCYCTTKSASGSPGPYIPTWHTLPTAQGPAYLNKFTEFLVIVRIIVTITLVFLMNLAKLWECVGMCGQDWLAEHEGLDGGEFILRLVPGKNC